MNANVQTLSDEEVIQRTKQLRSHASWMAIDELARRALENEQLLDAACAAISRDRAIGVHYVPYGSHAAVVRILESGNDRAIRRLLQEMDTWNENEQKDPVRLWAGGHQRLPEATRKLQERYGWSPKYVMTS